MNPDSKACAPEQDEMLGKYQRKIGDSPILPRVVEPSKNLPTKPNKGWDKIKGTLSSNRSQMLAFAICQCGFKTSKRLCPHCHNELPRQFGETDSHTIALLGTIESGKSHYITVLIHELKKHVAADFNAAFSEMDDQTIKRYKEDFHKRLYINRVVIKKTASARTDISVRYPLIYRLSIEKKKQIQASSMVFFDTAGDDLEEMDKMETETKYIARAQGLIFLIDPLQIPQLRDRVRDRNVLIPREIIDPGHIVTRLANLVRDSSGIAHDAKIDTPIAFAFSKIDAVLPFMQPDTPVKWDSNHGGFFDLEDFEQVNESMHDHLANWIGRGFEMFLRHNFTNYAFFGVSALGSAPDESGQIRKGIAPHRVVDPFLWVLYKLGKIKGSKGSQAPLSFEI